MFLDSWSSRFFAHFVPMEWHLVAIDDRRVYAESFNEVSSDVPNILRVIFHSNDFIFFWYWVPLVRLLFDKTSYSFSHPLIHWLEKSNLSHSGVGFCCNQFSYSYFVCNLNIALGKRPCKRVLASTNQKNNSARTSGAFDFRPPPTERNLFAFTPSKSPASNVSQI